ncbi:MAG: hypothetical protein JXR53_14105, partial [Bacteroidales bacterium]|nr:hypothetical protein [Bacteroidales bacterium]
MHKHRTNIFLVFGLMLLLFCSIKVFSQRGYENNYVNGNSSDAVNQSKANALHFDGVDDFVVIPHSKSLELNSITIELWVKSGTEVWNSMGSLISKRNDFLFHPMVGSKKIQFFF